MLRIGMNQATLAPYVPYLASLAEGWLSSGATGFGLWSAGQPLACWPAGAHSDSDALVARIKIGSQLVGELRALGAPAAGQRRLDAEASMFQQIARLEDELQQMTSELIDAQDQILALYDLSKSTRSHLGIIETLRSIAGESARLLRAEGAVMLLSPTLVHSPAPLVDDAALLAYFREVQASGREVVLNSGDLPAGVRSACFVPVRVRDTTSAVLGLLNKIDGWFNAPDLKLAQAIAEQAGAQLEHALLYQEMLSQARLQTEMELARDVQARLLPREQPRVAGAEIYAHSRPALHVGGDFYDFVQQPDHPIHPDPWRCGRQGRVGRADHGYDPHAAA
jgi:sigma-B regulation protein RsbU (phosphoserine phosphatase)